MSSKVIFTEFVVKRVLPTARISNDERALCGGKDDCFFLVLFRIAVNEYDRNSQKDLGVFKLLTLSRTMRSMFYFKGGGGLTRSGVR